MRRNRRRTILINGIRYYADRPDKCRHCYFWQNRKKGCILGCDNCYYLAQRILTEQEKKCLGCPYAKGEPCVSASCYRDLMKEFRRGYTGMPSQSPEGGFSYA